MTRDKARASASKVERLDLYQGCKDVERLRSRLMMKDGQFLKIALVPVPQHWLFQGATHAEAQILRRNDYSKLITLS